MSSTESSTILIKFDVAILPTIITAENFEWKTNLLHGQCVKILEDFKTFGFLA